MNIIQKRRDFIKTLGKGLLGGGAFSSGLVPLLANAQANSDYKALVCINLVGGNDGYNTLIPTGNSYAAYESIRKDIALPKANLLPLNALNSDIEPCALHPVLVQTQQLFHEGRLAIMANLGNLVEPVTRASYLDRRVELPPHLFSHIDQTIFSHTLGSNSEKGATNGWAGRVADAISAVNINQQLSMNISLSGDNHLQRTNDNLPYVVRKTGVSIIDALSEANPASFTASRAALYREFISRKRPHLLQQHFSNVQLNAWVMSQYVSNILQSQPPLNLPIFQSTSDLVKSLGMVVRLIAANKDFEVKRQIFYIDLPGFDTHRNQLTDHAKQLQELDKGLGEFYAALTAIGYQSKVTAFTLSEFGRTLSRNGNNGTDHGWTNHHLLMGGAVRGQRIFGNLPDINRENDYDIGEGRIIPQFSFDQYAATLCDWFGLHTEDINQIFPNLRNFELSNLGFMR